MLFNSKVIDFFYMAYGFCIFLMKQLKNIQSKMAKNIGTSQVISPMPK